MLDRQSSRALLKRMEYEASQILSNTPDSADYVTNADNLALDVQRLADYLNALDTKPVGPRHVHGDSMPCNVMCPAHPNTVKRSTPSWYAPNR